MIYALIFFICYSAVVTVVLAFFVYLTRHLTALADAKPPQVRHDAPAATQVALSLARQVTGLTAAEEADEREQARIEAWQANEGLADLGIDARELDMMGQLR